MSQDEPVTLPGDAEPEPEAPSALPADPVEPRASLPDLPLVAPSTTIESAAQNALIERVNFLSGERRLIQSWTTILASNALGDITIPYPLPFGNAYPIVLAQIASGAGGLHLQALDPAGRSATQAIFRLFYTTTGGPFVNSHPVRIDCIAVGNHP